MGVDWRVIAWGGEGMNHLTRRAVLRATLMICLDTASLYVLAACQRQPAIQVEKVVEKEVTKIVKELVRETVIVPSTPEIVERTVEVEKVVTTTPALKPRARIIAHGMTYAWTRFATQVAATFEEMFSGVTIEWDSLSGWQTYPEHIATLYAAGELGDLLEVPSGPLLVRWANNGILRAVDDLVATYGFDMAGLFKSALNDCKYKDRMYGLPFIGHPGASLLVYNRRLFDEAGVAYPQNQWTLDDLVQAGGKLTCDTDSDGRVDCFGYIVRYDNVNAYPMLHLFGAELFSRDGRGCLLRDADGITCVRWAYDQVHTHKIAPGYAQMEEGALAMFRRGKVAMMRQTLREFAELRRAEGGQDFEAVLFPRHPTTNRVAAMSSTLAYGISSTTPSAHDALQWIKFMSSREIGVQMLLGGYSYPGCRLASWQDARVVALYPVCAQLGDVADVAESERLPWNLRLAECMRVWDEQIVSLWYDEVTPEECVAHIAQKIDSILSQPVATDDSQLLSDYLLPW